MPFIPVAVVNEATAGPNFDAAYIAEVMADSPAALYPLNEDSGFPQDTSGNGNHMTTVDGSIYQGFPGPFGGQSTLFSRSGVERTRVLTATNDITLELWVWLLGSTSAEIDLLTNQGASRGYGINLLTTDRFRVVVQGVAVQATSTGAIPKKTWTHIAVRRSSADGNIWKYYIDGAVDTANAGTSNPNALAAGDTTKIFESTASFGAAVAFGALYASALSDARIAAHYAAATLV